MARTITRCTSQRYATAEPPCIRPCSNARVTAAAAAAPTCAIANRASTIARVPAGGSCPRWTRGSAMCSNWTRRYGRWVPVRRIEVERVTFDLQLLQNAEISGLEYQRGELTGWETRAYLLEKFGHRCAYCGKGEVPFELDHQLPPQPGRLQSRIQPRAGMPRLQPGQGQQDGGRVRLPTGGGAVQGPAEGRLLAGQRDASRTGASSKSWGCPSAPGAEGARAGTGRASVSPKRTPWTRSASEILQGSMRAVSRRRSSRRWGEDAMVAPTVTSVASAWLSHAPEAGPGSQDRRPGGSGRPRRVCRTWNAYWTHRGPRQRAVSHGQGAGHSSAFLSYASAGRWV